ncbi:MAG: GTPase ObgE [Candidatus Hydrogenedentes bacterium]|nr:GTPase ObgE [Candidatus Hydrogenedentota bacterium]
MFVDRARVRVTGGAGGNGCRSFRREKYVPRGGPNGGDGGNGGDVYFVADRRYTSLLDLKYHAHWKGMPGVHGAGSDCHGKNGEDQIIHVPLGTIVKRADDESIIADLTDEGSRFLAATGGKGGRGNARFATATERAPQFAEVGEPGADNEFLLELKVIAEVGLVGLPNAGKSTFLAAVSAARPKIAPYPFTTLSPNLGVVPLSDFRTLTIADIPGIIEGAADGKGLGHDFLRHIERTKVLLFLIDLGDEDPAKTKKILESELAQYSDVFETRPRVYALNKADIPENQERFKKLKRRFKSPWLISGATGEGIDKLLEHLWQTVDQLRREEDAAPQGTELAEYAYEAPYTVERVEDGFRVDGKVAVRAVRMTNFDNEDAVRHLQKRFKKMGILKALKRIGAKEGDSVFVGDAELEYHPD